MAWTSTKAGNKGPEIAILLSELATNDSSKDLLFADIGEGSHLELVAIRIELTTTATGGTRTMVCEVLTEADDVVYEMILDANTLGPSLSKTWQLGVEVDPAVTAPQYVVLPQGLALFPGQKLRIRDSAAIDPTADDMLLHVHGLLKNAG